MFYTSLYAFVEMIVHLIVLISSNEKIQLNSMPTREINVFQHFCYKEQLKQMH